MYLQQREAPVAACTVSSGLEHRQADQRHGGGDGQRPDGIKQESRNSHQPNYHFHHTRHNNGPLDL